MPPISKAKRRSLLGLTVARGTKIEKKLVIVPAPRYSVEEVKLRKNEQVLKDVNKDLRCIERNLQKFEDAITALDKKLIYTLIEELRTMMSDDTLVDCDKISEAQTSLKQRCDTLFDIAKEKIRAIPRKWRKCNEDAFQKKQMKRQKVLDHMQYMSLKCQLSDSVREKRLYRGKRILSDLRILDDYELLPVTKPSSPSESLKLKQILNLSNARMRTMRTNLRQGPSSISSPYSIEKYRAKIIDDYGQSTVIEINVPRKPTVFATVFKFRSALEAMINWIGIDRLPFLINITITGDYNTQSPKKLMPLAYYEGSDSDEYLRPVFNFCFDDLERCESEGIDINGIRLFIRFWFVGDSGEHLHKEFSKNASKVAQNYTVDNHRQEEYALCEQIING
ncbi:hypothetical protein FO519_009895, partial [Halicephalobus sp. NKZ332]